MVLYPNFTEFDLKSIKNKSYLNIVVSVLHTITCIHKTFCEQKKHNNTMNVNNKHKPERQSDNLMLFKRYDPKDACYMANTWLLSL